MEDFTLVVNDDIRTQLTHHVGRHWMIDQLTVADIEDMLPFLPENITQVVDLCCGSGRVSIAFDKLVTHGKAKFWLVDGNVQNEVDNIKTVGAHTATASLHSDVSFPINIVVVAAE